MSVLKKPTNTICGRRRFKRLETLQIRATCTIYARPYLPEMQGGPLQQRLYKGWELACHLLVIH